MADDAEDRFSGSLIIFGALGFIVSLVLGVKPGRAKLVVLSMVANVVALAVGGLWDNNTLPNDSDASIAIVVGFVIGAIMALLMGPLLFMCFSVAGYGIIGMIPYVLEKLSKSYIGTSGNSASLGTVHFLITLSVCFAGFAGSMGLSALIRMVKNDQDTGFFTLPDTVRRVLLPAIGFIAFLFGLVAAGLDDDKKDEIKGLAIVVAVIAAVGGLVLGLSDGQGRSKAQLSLGNSAVGMSATTFGIVLRATAAAGSSSALPMYTAVSVLSAIAVIIALVVYMQWSGTSEEQVRQNASRLQEMSKVQKIIAAVLVLGVIIAIMCLASTSIHESEFIAVVALGIGFSLSSNYKGTENTNVALLIVTHLAPLHMALAALNEATPDIDTSDLTKTAWTNGFVGYIGIGGAVMSGLRFVIPALNFIRNRFTLELSPEEGGEQQRVGDEPSGAHNSAGAGAGEGQHPKHDTPSDAEHV
mmetsp:Transcript_27590/g.88726  ORF Transcript_27590/g.88726 Transcript_27590/m.88726 type:complete len:471 (+) Transcript_27590:20-1432(+)|eukprot:CAMPEP_0196780716 /NCGR_PEP_ID=MMETSP1104-20130614/8456_1 /TAXON_ID=33652 /ORGANISM="Cafeteria sp., Strain Caron Lab Isolate" /LENGTH=470 /DNA_ID=CAMNT_0042150931 /DNA_START=14 /DNA_END=1426 /DNA_ORIENTATION=-